MRILRSHAHAAQPWLFAALNTLPPHLDTSVIPFAPSPSLATSGTKSVQIEERSKSMQPLNRLLREIMDGFARPRHNGKPPEETPGSRLKGLRNLADREADSIKAAIRMTTMTPCTPGVLPPG
jgi:hypothetical protein